VEKECLIAKISKLNNMVNQLNSQLNHVIKQVKMMTTRTYALDEILEGQIQGKPNGIVFTFEHSNQNQQIKTFDQVLEEYEMFKKKKTKPIKNIKFVASTKTKNPTISKGMLQHTKEHQMPEVAKVSSLKICHFCNSKGRIRPFCHKQHGFQQQDHQKEQKPKGIKVKKVWKPKANLIGLMARLFSRTFYREEWYFDSGCSKHMSGFKKPLDIEKICTNKKSVHSGTEAKAPAVTVTPKTKSKTTSVGPKKGWSKVQVKSTAGRSRKRTIIISFVSKKSVGKKVEVYAQRWKFIYHRRLALERQLAKEALEMQIVMNLINEAGLLKTVSNLGNCYEKLVKEFLVNISEDCDNPLS